MEKKLNCWEFMDCGYVPDGEKAEFGGICPVVTMESLNGVNHGKNGGRYCWHVSDAFCQTGSGEMNETGTLACARCEFYKYVQNGEGESFRA